MNKDLYNASRFLLYTYFGLDFDASKDETIRKAVNMAYKDATLMGAFNTTKEKDDKGEHRKNTVIEALDKPIDDFEKWHTDLCSELEEKDKGFSYGNAQKLVNMTVKNMHIIFSVIKEFNPDNKFVAFFKGNFLRFYSQFQVPVDDYILEAAWNLEDENDKFENKMIKFPKNENVCKTKSGKYNSEKIVRWSSWDKPLYESFQTSLKGFVNQENPIDWEYNAWVEIAKTRKTKAVK